jgi:hypothetical protein
MAVPMLKNALAPHPSKKNGASNPFLAPRRTEHLPPPLESTSFNELILHVIISFMSLATNCVTHINQSKRKNKN